jgi:hypothetical protein
MAGPRSSGQRAVWHGNGDSLVTNIAHYPGRVDHDPTALYGADKFGAFYRADSVTYDAETDTSTIQFKPIPPIELDDFTADKMAQLEDKARLIQLFGGHW